MTSSDGNRRELGAAERARHPHRPEPGVVERFDDLVGERAARLRRLGVLVGERDQALGRAPRGRRRIVDGSLAARRRSRRSSPAPR